MLDFARIKQLRKLRKLSQEQAAERAGLGSKGRWNDIESGRRPNVTLDTLDAIARVLRTSPGDLLAVDRKIPTGSVVVPDKKEMTVSFLRMVLRGQPDRKVVRVGLPMAGTGHHEPSGPLQWQAYHVAGVEVEEGEILITVVL